MAEDEYFLRNQIISLSYELLKSKPDMFMKVNENTVTCFLEKSNLMIQNAKSGIMIQVAREEKENIWNYKLSCVLIDNGRPSINVFISSLDAKTAFKFFQTEKQMEFELESLKHIRDIFLRELE